MEINLDQSSPIFPDISIPNVIGCYSTDANLNVHYDNSEFRYYYPPWTMEHDNIFTLTNGIGGNLEGRPKISDYQRLLWILQWIKLNFEMIKNVTSERRIKPDFIIGGEMLFKVMQTPYAIEQAFNIHAVKWQGSIYMCGFDESDEKTPLESSEKDEPVAWEIRFKQFVSTTDPRRVPESSENVSEGGEFHRVMQRRFVDNQLLYDSWIGLLDSDKKRSRKPLELRDKLFVVPRTIPKYLTGTQEEIIKRSKYMKWWTRGFIDNIDRYIVGHRTENGVVKKIAPLQVSHLETEAKGAWLSIKCVHFLNKFLDHVRETFVNDCDGAVHIFNKPSGSVLIGMARVMPSPERSFLPSWFTESTNVI